LLIFVFVVESAVPALPVSNPAFGDFGRFCQITQTPKLFYFFEVFTPETFNSVARHEITITLLNHRIRQNDSL
jgi:hypothetical protein